jgi:hypothetical protein
MIPEEISQLIEDCNVKREILASHREKINVLQKELLKFAAKSLPKEDLTDLEHYQNQFHIQLINIHDLKHDLKLFQHLLKSDTHLQDSPSGETATRHQELLGQFHTLENLLRNLENDFSDFVKKPHEAGV